MRSFFFGGFDRTGESEPMHADRLDALAVGLSLGVLGIPVGYPALVIGLTTGLLSIAGVRLGQGVGARLGRPFQIVGGVLLIGIGLRILVLHLMGS